MIALPRGPFKQLFIASFLVLALIFSYALINQKEPQKWHPSSKFQGPDALMTGIKIQNFDPQGQLSRTLTAISAQQFTATTSTLLQNPILYWETLHQESWEAMATSGILQGKDLLNLKHGVTLIVLTSTGHPNQAEQYRIDTEEMQVNLVDKLASSQAYVKMINKAHRIDGLGFFMDLKQEFFTLNAQVHSVFHFEQQQ